MLPKKNEYDTTHLSIPAPIAPLIISGKIGWWFTPHGAYYEGDALQLMTISGEPILPDINTVASIHGDEEGYWLPNAETITPILVFPRFNAMLNMYSLMGQTFKKGEYVFLGNIGGQPPEFNQIGCTIEFLNLIEIPLDIIYQTIGYLEMTCNDVPTKIDFVQWGQKQIAF